MADRLSVDGLRRFRDVAASYVGDDAVPGLVAVVAHGEQVHVEALGSLSIGGPPVERDSEPVCKVLMSAERLFVAGPSALVTVRCWLVESTA